MREDRNLRIIQALTSRLDEMTDEEIPRLRAEIAARDRLIADLRGADDLTEARIRMDRAYLDSWTAYYDHLEALRLHTRAVFAWQQFASDATLWLVVLVVLAGVGLSVYEITNSVRRAERAAARGGRGSRSGIRHWRTRPWPASWMPLAPYVGDHVMLRLMPSAGKRCSFAY